MLAPQLVTWEDVTLMPQPRHDARTATRSPSERAGRLIFVGTALAVVVAVVILVGVLLLHRPDLSESTYWLVCQARIWPDDAFVKEILIARSPPGSRCKSISISPELSGMRSP
jgi:hypothetical protein